MKRVSSSSRALARSALALACGLVLAAGTGVASAAQTPAAGAGSNPYLPTYQHPYRHGAVPSITGHQKAEQWAKANPAVTRFASTAGNLQYNGGNDGIGVTLGKPRVYLVFWGNQWGTSSTATNGDTTFSGDASGMAQRLQDLFKGIGTNGEQWSGVMTQYCEDVSSGATSCPVNSRHVGYPVGGALAGVWYDNGSAAPNNASHDDIASEATTAASHFGNTNSVLNRSAQYFVVSPTGTHPDGFAPGTSFCAWHDWTGSSAGDIAYTNMPYLLDVGATCGSGFVNGSTGGALDGVTIVAGHEYAETITDQNPRGGWTGPGDETGDECAWIGSGQGAAVNISFSTGTFAMQSTWSNDFNNGAGGCVTSHPIVGQDSTSLAGYVWNDRASQSGCYQPDPTYSYSSRGAVNTICRNGTGSYTVHFGDLSSGRGNVQVTGYGATPANCKIAGWFPLGTEELADVLCYSSSGSAQDSLFTASFTDSEDPFLNYAYAWADQPTAASYTPSPTYQFDRYGTTTIIRNSVGTYTVNFPMPASTGLTDTVKVTAYGFDSSYCNVLNWFPSGGAEHVNVQCYTASGALSDEYFSLVYGANTNLLGDSLLATAYAWGNQPSTSSYTPSTFYQRDTTIVGPTTVNGPNSGTITVNRVGTGAYSVVMPLQNQGLDGGTIQVVEYSNAAVKCQVGSWFSTGASRIARVNCFNPGGAFTDAPFVFNYTARVQ